MVNPKPYCARIVDNISFTIKISTNMGARSGGGGLPMGWGKYRTPGGQTYLFKDKASLKEFKAKLKSQISNNVDIEKAASNAYYSSKTKKTLLFDIVTK